MKKNPLSLNYFLAWTLASLTIFTAQNVAQATTQTFLDSTFGTGWSDVLLPSSTSSPATCTATQDTANGNPVPSRLTIHTYGIGHIDCAHPYAPSAYDPANQGQIVNLSYSYDLKDYTTGGVNYSILVYQNNTYYYHVPNDAIYLGAPWTTFSGSNLTAASFTKLAGSSSNANPDFSCTGAPIVFGYVTRNSNTITGKIDTTKSDIDNWKVSIDKTTPCCVPRPPKMVAWWQLDEANGATAVTDIAGFNNQGTPKPGGHVGTGGPSSVSGEVHGALYFVGPYVEVPPQTELDFGPGDFSIDAWVRPVDCSHSGGGHFSPIVDKFNGTTTGFSFYLDQPTVGVAHLYLKINGSPAFASSGSNGTIPTLGPPTWSHVAVTVARPSSGPAVGTFYVNGLPAGTFVPPTGSVTNTLPLWIGKTHVPGGICENAIDELELFSRALLPAEIKSIADAKSIGKCP